ncbi:uncharacterized protein BT62DRAFT_265714 [Guyanagaster necrorhizus]|uniref:Uncharacterized protein n=1 Tax=Guyanagaster necrorhizus TaxID=856835 RepID=A0A9P7W3A8_9AGAR|nr:uncharacterized protein BT62DRAFT_265714 [Guyanagaster necrorhizus MCA 3950]KAG7451794.1 hypothetical protein BT62DRAFT_265714 [Guyanagaster necrorhizus MCA 3950]
MILKYPQTSCPFICFCVPLAQQDRASEIHGTRFLCNVALGESLLAQRIESTSSEVVSSSLARGVIIDHRFSHPCNGPMHNNQPAHQTSTSFGFQGQRNITSRDVGSPKSCY